MKRFLLNFNWALFLVTIALVTLGIVFICSAGSARSLAVLQNAWRVHAVTAVCGLAIMVALSLVDYRKLLDWTATPIFVFSLVMLLAVLIFGSKIYGGRRWLWFFQPSEVAKLALILFTAHVFGSHGGRLAGFKGFLVGLAILVPPALLILAEPDLGTALVLAPTVLTMLFAARIWIKGLIALLLVTTLAAGIILGTVKVAESQRDPEVRDRILSHLPFKEHQIKRLRTFVNPDIDPYGSGWNLRQAKISIGSGSITGKGIGKGEQKILGYLPPSVSMNDFIFSVLAEEAGFLGTAFVLVLFFGLYATITFTAIRCRDDRGRLVAIGVTTLIFSHMYINVAMSIGLMPITGLPLPFISAGKTFLLIMLAALGVVESVAVHGREEVKTDT